MAILTKILGFMGGLVSGPLAWLFSLVMDYIGAKVKAAWDSWMLSRKQKQIADANVEKDKEATASGDLNAIADAGTDLLNGNDKH